MSEVYLANLFFVFSSAFIIGNFLALTKYWFLFNFILSLFFYLKFKNLKISVLFLLLLFLGSFYYFLRQELKFPSLQQPQIILEIRSFLETKIKENLPFSYENIFRGLLFGSKFDDHKLKEEFIKSGLSHITAVSGQNLTIMFSIIYETLKEIKFLTPNLLFLILNFFILFFILIMGFEGNVLRAGIMAFFLILAKQKFGRIVLRRNLLILTALIFTLINPDLLIKDIGTQLSFLAITGILYLSPIFEKKLEFLKYTYVKKIISEILSAQIFTFPLIMYYFGYFNLFSFFSNLLVLPLLPLTMMIIALFLFLPFKFIAWLSIPFLVYILFVVKIFSALPLVYFKINLFILLIIYLMIFIEIYYFSKNETIDFRLDFS